MEIILTPNALEDLNYWKEKNDKKTLQRIRLLIEHIQASPFSGIGKPEPLKHNFQGMWSRRIDQRHRLIYEISAEVIFIHALREHY